MKFRDFLCDSLHLLITELTYFAQSILGHGDCLDIIVMNMHYLRN